MFSTLPGIYTAPPPPEFQIISIYSRKATKFIEDLMRAGIPGISGKVWNVFTDFSSGKTHFKSSYWTLSETVDVSFLVLHLSCFLCFQSIQSRFLSKKRGRGDYSKRDKVGRLKIKCLTFSFSLLHAYITCASTGAESSFSHCFSPPPSIYFHSLTSSPCLFLVHTFHSAFFSPFYSGRWVSSVSVCGPQAPKLEHTICTSWLCRGHRALFPQRLLL